MSIGASLTPERRRLIGSLALVVGLVLASLPVLSHVPREQTLVFRLEDRSVTRLDASFTQAGEPTPLGAVTLRFPDRAPRSVRHQVSLPNGEYVIAVEVESAERPGKELSEPASPAEGRRPHIGRAPRPDGELSSGSQSARETSFVRRVSLQGGETVIAL
jgi:hypothetical protein